MSYVFDSNILIYQLSDTFPHRARNYCARDCCTEVRIP